MDSVWSETRMRWSTTSRKYGAAFGLIPGMPWANCSIGSRSGWTARRISSTSRLSL